MLKLLLKKQFLEIFQVYFYDAKKNKARSKTSTVMYFVLFFLLVFGFLGGIFTFLAMKLCMPLIYVGMDWLYFALMGLISVLLGAFGSVFNTYAGLYLPKDNNLLLAMPIPIAALVGSRLIGVYLMGLLYSVVVILPAIIVYWVTAGVTLQTVLGGLLITMVISVFVLTISCVSVRKCWCWQCPGICNSLCSGCLTVWSDVVTAFPQFFADCDIYGESIP